MPTETDLPSRLASSRDPGSDSGWVCLRRGAFRWNIDKSFGEEWLDDHGELPVSAWLSEGLAKIVKTGPHRAVYRLRLPSGIYYLKHYRTPDWRAVLQNLIRPAKADLEQRAAKKVAGLGLKTFETAAIGRRYQLGLVRDNYLITREIPDARPLDEFVLKTFPSLSPKAQRSVGSEIAKQLGEMTARLHRGGLLHQDLHPGNVLIQDPTGGLELYLIDLHALRRKRRLSLAQMAWNLSLLNNFFARLTSKADRWRFLDAYAEIWNREVSTSPFDREAVRFVERICRAELEKADRRGDKKWQRGNRRLIILENPPNRCRGLSVLGRELLESLQADPEQLFAEPYLIAWQKQDQSQRRAAVEVRVNSQQVPAIASAFSKRNRARNGWEMGHALLRRRLPGPRPLLFVETESGEWDYLLVEQIPGAVSLEMGLAELDRECGLNDLLMEFAVQLRKLHEQGFHQPDLSLNSILIEARRGQCRLWFAGLEHFRKLSRIDSRLAMESLADCFSSVPAGMRPRRSLLLRFLRSYLGLRFSAEWKTYWRGIASLAASFPKMEAA